MPILWTQAARIIHLLVFSILCALMALFPLPGLSLEISTPVGVQQIGQILNLKSTLSNMPEGTESQLRSTCLKARIFTLGNAPGSYESTLSREVLVNFDPTIRRGGLLEFTSLAPVEDAVVEMELVSECPLLVFNTRWTLLMKQGGGEQSGVTRLNPVSKESAFNPEGSTLLAKSRKSPTPRVESKPAWMVLDEKLETKPKQTQEDAPEIVVTAPQNEVVSGNEGVKVASLDTDLFGAGLIESRKASTDAFDGLGLSEYGGDTSDHHNLQEWLIPVSLGASVLLMISLVFYRRYSGRRSNPQSALNEYRREGQPAHVSPSKDVAAGGREHVTAFSGEAASKPLGSNRVLESLIGNDEHHFDEDLDSPVHQMNNGLIDPVCRSSLKISLDLINRADIPSWKLPASYLGLVESRNKSLQLHRTIDALLLRSQIGLIELAFQDAKQGQLTPAQSSQELLELVLGDQIHELESRQTLGVPDVVKSHVRAKMCEISGAENRQLLRENLLSLHGQTLGPALCFNSNAWREFLSEEGILD